MARFLLDLCYEEDSKADVDMNFVMTGTGKFIEVQGTAESAPFTKKQMERMAEIAHRASKSCSKRRKSDCCAELKRLRRDRTFSRHHQPGKFAEVRAFLAKLPLKILSLQDLTDPPTVIEDGETFEEPTH